MAYTVGTAFNLGSSTSGISGGFSNVGQVGDLSNWYYWTCPTTGYYYFDTRGMTAPGGATGPSFPTTIAPYLLGASPHTPVQMSDLSSLATSELPAGKEGTRYGFEYGALVAIPCTAGAVYYFQVNSRDGVSTGSFNVEWKPYSFLSLGGCGTCTPASTGLCKIGSGAISNVHTATASNSFGATTYPSGNYILDYCGGAQAYFTGAPWQVGSPSSGGTGQGLFLFYSLGAGYRWLGWVTDPNTGVIVGPKTFFLGDIVSDGSNFYQCTTAVTYPGGSHPFYPGPSTNPNFAPASNIINLNNATNYATQAAAVAANLCTSYSFCHTGGQIILAWCEQYPTAGYDYNGTPNPTFGLFLFSPSQNLALSVQSISNTGASGGGYTYSVTVQITNGNLRFNSGNFTISLENAGVISSASAAVAVGPIGPGSNTTVTFTFYSAAADTMSGTFQFLDCDGNVDGTQNLLLAEAIWAFPASIPNTLCNGSMVGYNHNCTLTVHNTGVLPITSVTATLTPQFNYVFLGGAGVSNTCSLTLSSGSLTFTTGSIAPGGSTTLLFGAVRNPPSGFNLQYIYIASNDGALTVPTSTNYSDLY